VETLQSKGEQFTVVECRFVSACSFCFVKNMWTLFTDGVVATVMYCAVYR
jgi:hypothetical protein